MFFCFFSGNIIKAKNSITSLSLKKKQSRGFTFLEVLISMSILLLVCLVLFNMFQTSLKYSSKTDKELKAALLASRRVEEIRSEAYTFDTDHYKFNDFAAPYSDHQKVDDYDIYTRVEMGGPAYEPTAQTGERSFLYFPSTGTEIKSA